MMKKTFASLMLAAMVAGCANQGGLGSTGVNKSQIGGVLGGVGGAVAGAQFGKGTGRLATTATGALLGAWLGSSIGASLDEVDQMKHQQTATQAFEYGRSGVSQSWSNPDTGHSGSVTPINVVQQPNGSYCREYKQTITVDGQLQQAYGTACRQPDGTWRVQS